MKFRLLNSNLTVGNSKSWPRGLNLMERKDALQFDVINDILRRTKGVSDSVAMIVKQWQMTCDVIAHNKVHGVNH